MTKDRLLWADDEIDLLKPHILFLEAKGYEVVTTTNGQDALDICKEQNFDLIFLDENMPGLSGIETLNAIKTLYPSLPVVMITKSEEEDIMNQAIGNKIADYLIKPVNPMQMLLTLKKNIHKQEIIQQNTTSTFQQNFSRISQQIDAASSIEAWMEVYKKLVYWELELEETKNPMSDVLRHQKSEANALFAKFIKKHYIDWIDHPENRPMMSPDVFKRCVFPALDKGEHVFFLLIDNFRLDQWHIIKKLLEDRFNTTEELYISMLPTATQYARNAIFSGLNPLQIQEMFPDLWVDEEEEEGKNQNESPLIQTQLERFRKPYAFNYHKINNNQIGERLLSKMKSMMDTPLNVIVFNFIDMLSHARTESKMIRELANTEAAYRSLTESWYKHSAIYELMDFLADQPVKIILTTDHGTIRVDTPVKVVGDRNTNTNLRYKVGKSLNYDPKKVFEIKNPIRHGLPAPNVSSTYIFALENDFFAYPNNYNHYASYYKDTFQHGGISMEEMIIPIITLESKRKS
ncbi:MAG: bifunctional response regulator/alkaline phosphatase family protein [Bacteroidales bacterium]|nr:bifunctional response regulator/alkaline phosphatase family protein [Bacteroidales bacterium]